MKKEHVMAAWVSVITVASVCFVPACKRLPAESSTGRVDRLFAEWNRPDSPGCNLGVSQHGVLVYERGHGMANLGLSVPITPASVFPAASISEQLTAMIIL